MSKSRAVIIWLTGLSGAGKSSIADATAKILRRKGRCIKVFDGDAVRRRVTRHLGFRPEHIVMNNLKIARLCECNRDKYDVIFVSAISPFSRARAMARRILKNPFYLIYIKASLNAVIKRDPKGLYKKALNGMIRNFIGIDESVPFEPPRRADLVINTERYSLSTAVIMLRKFVAGVLKKRDSRGMA